ncbi:methylation-associated defense system ATP-binding protein MAD8 [Streptomyces krungchingensis]|uniref:methylation-associated defense system ATP-binding protein MAD8 n=1 Tax=Streptomyces krungchingensis TaxID=1565034 RepID=UPI003CFA4FB7
MARGLTEITESQWRQALEQALLPRIASVLRRREAGHCMRVEGLQTDVAVSLTRRLHTAVPEAQVHVLDAGTLGTDAEDVTITSTRLVELRNPDDTGALRPPLLLFVPPGTRASAEDSFSTATFEELLLDDVHAALRQTLLSQVPEALRPSVTELLGSPAAGGPKGADAQAAVRYLLTLRENHHHPEAAGAAVHLLGLIPDFRLFSDPALVGHKSKRNRRVVDALSDSAATPRQRVLALGLPRTSLDQQAFMKRLVAFAGRTSFAEPRDWCRAIAVEPGNWPLAFHHWPEEQDRGDQRITVEVADLTALPKVGDSDEDLRNHPVLERVFGTRYLLPGGLSSLPVSFTVDPDARTVAGLAHFKVEIYSESVGEGGDEDDESSVAVSPTGLTATFSANRRTTKNVHKTQVKLKRGRRATEWEEGWHFVRVTPLDDRGQPLPVPRTNQARRTDESDRFYVVPEGEFDEPPAPRVQHASGVAQALNRLRFTARAEGRDPERVTCRDVTWASTGTKTRSLRASFGSGAPFLLDLPLWLAEAQQWLLGRPDSLTGPTVEIDAADGAHLRLDALPAACQADATPPFTTFLHTRAVLFSAITGESTGEDAHVVEGRDPRDLRSLTEAYAEAYLNALTACLRTLDDPYQRDTDTHRRELQLLLRTDTLPVALATPDGNRSDAVLVAPTHPLRMLWESGHAALADHWLGEAEHEDRAAVLERLEALERRLAPLGFPLTVPLDTGELTFAVGLLTNYWQVCLPSETENPRGTVARIATALGADGAAATSGDVTGADLADRVERYIRLHPYADCLIINAVGAGRGELLTDMLIALQERRHLAHLRYTVRLFTPTPDDPWAGAALTDLFAPGDGARTAAVEAFSTPGDPLRPKLSVVVRDLADLTSADEGFPAHLTFLFAPFGGERHDIAPGRPGSGRAAVHGLVQEMTSHYSEDGGSAVWSRRPRHGATDPLPGAEITGDLLASLPATLSAAAVAATAGEPRPGMLPQISLSLGADDRSLLHDVHRMSDWVITVDRTLGAEYFDHGRRNRAEYVIDYTASSVAGMSSHVVVSSRSVDELRALLEPVLADRRLSIEQRHVRTFFDQLRELSGNLAFKLAALSESGRTEVVGLALARLYLETCSALRHQILLPLDSHPELYAEEQRRSAAGDTEVRLHRTDLALFDLDAERATITCRLVEVKCFTGSGGLASLESTRQRIRTQLDNTRRVLTSLFDPSVPRSDRPLQNVTLRTLLGHYLSRADRYGLFSGKSRDEARWLLDHLDHHFTWEFSATGLVFDLSANGLDIEAENGITYHRVGREHALRMLDEIQTEYLRGPADAAERPETAGEDEADTTRADLLPGTAWSAPFTDTDAAALATLRPRERERIVPDEPGPLPLDTDGDDPGHEDESCTANTQELSAEPAPEDAEDLPPEPEQSGDASHRQRESSPSAPTDSAEDTKEGDSAADTHGATADVVLGVAQPSPQFGLLGTSAGRQVALDLYETHTMSLFGVQGGGKSYTLGAILEMASRPVPGINRLARPLASMVFHYSETSDYAPEFTSMIRPNGDEVQRTALRLRYGAEPVGLKDVMMLVPTENLEDRREEFPDMEIRPLTFASSELKMSHWRFLMGAVGNQATYIRQVNRIIKENRKDLTLEAIRHGIEDSELADHLKKQAKARLELAKSFIDDTARLCDLVRPGRLIIVDVRSDDIEKSDALGLFVVLMQLFAEARQGHETFNKLVVFDEAHKYADSGDLVGGLVSSVREMRHKGMSVIVASQDPPSVPTALIELSSEIVLHKFTSPAWLKYLQKVNTALGGLTPQKMAALQPGEAYLWSSKATDEAFTQGTVKVLCRPRVTEHGGGTRTAFD